MCGIVAGSSTQNMVPILLDGLFQLEYRGYDSAGIAVIHDKALTVNREVGRVQALSERLAHQPVHGNYGIAHTRWATHGMPAEQNAHPHSHNGLAIVHNGIIEDFERHRQHLTTLGYRFVSETDTEVIVYAIDHALNAGAENLCAAVRAITSQLLGTFAIAAVHVDYPGQVVVAKKGSPLVIGRNDEGYYAASDGYALIELSDAHLYLENGDVALFDANQLTVYDGQGQVVTRAFNRSELYSRKVTLAGHDHYMHKEMFEQPIALADTLELIAASQHVSAQFFGSQANGIFKQVKSILILACGTSYYAGLTARYWLEQMTRLPTVVEIASEYRYRHAVYDPDTLVVCLSQSGETADTLAALKHAQSQGMNKTLTICNVPESSLIRQSPLRFLTRAGPEIGVASTKAFVTQLVSVYLLSLVLAKIKGRLSPAAEAVGLRELRHLPQAVTEVLALEPQLMAWADLTYKNWNALFLGRGVHYPIALEGALKLKEISYMHAEAYPSGELKHGPLALVDRQMPVFAIAPNDQLLNKLKSNLHEVRSRGGHLYVLADVNSHIEPTPDVDIIRMPEHYGNLSPVLYVVPLQLLAYHVALRKGTDIDKPRNLAKSVTVE